MFGFGASETDPFEVTVKPFVRQNCAMCHNAKVSSGDLNLQQFLSGSGAAALKDREHWEKVAEKLRSGEMPPKTMKRPPEEQVAIVTQWIDREFARLDREAKPIPGRVTAHRLNRYEYNNSVRDLLHINLRVADDFPVDPYGYGFDNIGDVLSMSPVLTEKYLKAAEQIGKAAVPTDQPEKLTMSRYMAERAGQANQLHVNIVHQFPVDGRYMLRSGWFQGFKPGYKMTARFFVDGKQITNQAITIYTEMDRAFEAHDVALTQGPHKIEAEIEIPADTKGPKPYVEYIQVHGPTSQTATGLTASYKRIFGCGHRSDHHRPECARRILTPIAHRAFRRPPSQEEINNLLRLVTMVKRHGGNFETGIRVAIEAILMSPNFLFRIERDQPAQSAGAQKISDIELASRLSYFLWSSIPDDELLGLAEKNRLRAPGVLLAQVKRMTSDPKARALVENFGGEWLQTRNLEVLKPDPEKFPEFDAELRDDMRTETEMFFESILKEDRSVLDFIDARFTFLNERLAKHYGIDGIKGRDFRRHELDGRERSGVLTQASVLTISSYPTRTSPVIRGKWVLETLLNAPPPPPPPDVPALDEKATGTSVSMRQQLEKHRSNALCASCHARMDPLGFGLENYDAIGRWRSMDGKFPVDASGALPSGKTFTGSAELKAILKADSQRFVRALTEKMLTYALGRGLELYDRPAVAEIARRLESKQFRFSELIQAVAESVPFQMRSVGEEAVKREVARGN